MTNVLSLYAALTIIRNAAVEIETLKASDFMIPDISDRLAVLAGDIEVWIEAEEVGE